MNDKEVIAEGALLLVPEQVGLQHLRSALPARRDDGHGHQSSYDSSGLGERVSVQPGRAKGIAG